MLNTRLIYRQASVLSKGGITTSKGSASSRRVYNKSSRYNGIMSTESEVDRPNLLLCFDAFGTLFEPKPAVHTQYVEIADELGMKGLSDDEVLASFKKAFKNASKINPNYGKATNLGAEKWWTNVIQDTFEPFAPNGQLPPQLAPRLLNRFAGLDHGKGYALFRDALAPLQAARETNAGHGRFGRVVVGVLTNSDDRVPSVLTGLGVPSSPLRYSTGLDKATGPLDLSAFDIHFFCMSYDVGAEKPDKRIFTAAEEMLRHICGDVDVINQSGQPNRISDTWQRMYIGDEIEKDGEASVSAGWTGVVVERGDRDTSGRLHQLDSKIDLDHGFGSWVSNAPTKPISIPSLDVVARWIRGVH